MELETTAGSSLLSGLAALSGRLVERTHALEARLGSLGEWLNSPEDGEGVAARIIFLALVFVGAVALTVGGCLAIFMLSNAVRVAECLASGAVPCPFFIEY
ncbi:MAG: hypothetical protein IT326_04365 [Anaerolineae bacterium]|nr:hypothetical protein [Anaerolineae bacterium]